MYTQHTSGLALALLGALLLACSSERRIDPINPHYSLLVGLVPLTEQTEIDVIDTDTDSIVERIRDLEGPVAMTIVAATDGSAIAVLKIEQEIALFDRQTLLRTGLAPTRATNIAFVGSPPRLAAVSGDSVVVYSVPGLHVDTVWHREMRRILPLSTGDQFIAAAVIWDSISQQPGWGLIRMDAWTAEITDSFPFRSALTPYSFYPWATTLSSDGKRFYAVGSDRDGSAVAAYDLVTGLCLFRQSLETDIGGIAVIPEQNELWVVQGYERFISPIPKHMGYVLILDAQTGLAKDTIRTLGMREGAPDKPLGLGAIIGHPDNPSVYVTSSSGFPSVLKFNSTTRRLEKVVYGSPQSVYGICVIPR